MVDFELRPWVGPFNTSKSEFDVLYVSNFELFVVGNLYNDYRDSRFSMVLYKQLNVIKVNVINVSTVYCDHFLLVSGYIV